MLFLPDALEGRGRIPIRIICPYYTLMTPHRSIWHNDDDSDNEEEGVVVGGSSPGARGVSEVHRVTPQHIRLAKEEVDMLEAEFLELQDKSIRRETLLQELVRAPGC